MVSSHCRLGTNDVDGRGSKSVGVCSECVTLHKGDEGESEMVFLTKQSAVDVLFFSKQLHEMIRTMEIMFCIVFSRCIYKA